MKRIHVRFHRDDTGALRADSAECPRLGELLEQDVQESIESGQFWLDRTAEVEQGGRGVWQASGNAFKVTLTPHEASIESLFHTPTDTVTIPLAEFRQALMLWLEYVRRG